MVKEVQKIRDLAARVLRETGGHVAPPSMKNILYDSLLKYLGRPILYERTTEKFWNDPHIAKQLLKAHLEPDIDGASRSPEFINESTDWIVSFLPKAKHSKSQAALLDLGCGPGLYTRLFAQRGLQVTGLDFSKNSIAYARQHDPDSKYILQNYLSMNFDNMFDMITMIYCDYGALIPQERKKLLGRVHKALKPGGLFLFDVLIAPPMYDEMDSTSWDIYPDGDFWSPKPHICLEAEYYYDNVAHGSRHVIIEEDSIKCYNIWSCYFTKQSLQDETLGVGFSEVGFYGDVSGQPYADNSETLCAVLKKMS